MTCNTQRRKILRCNIDYMYKLPNEIKQGSRHWRSRGFWYGVHALRGVAYAKIDRTHVPNLH
jgi:hypothetical protein